MIGWRDIKLIAIGVMGTTMLAGLTASNWHWFFGYLAAWAVFAYASFRQTRRETT